jgi:hypothetical protein
MALSQTQLEKKIVSDLAGINYNIMICTHVVTVYVLVWPFAVYSADIVQHGTVLGGSEPLAGHVRRQHL